MSYSPVPILIVDDQPANAIALRAILSVNDYQFVEAHSGAEALKHLLREEFAVVLLDVRMPAMDGFEVAAMMRQREKTRAVPILFLTGEALDSADMYRGYTAGAVDYLLKPLDPFVVRAKVAVFAELFRQKEQIRRQTVQLMQAERNEHELAVAELKLANERKEKALLEDALRVRDEFLSLASHELKTPLTPLLGHLQVLMRSAWHDNGVAHEGRVAKSLDVAIRQVHRLARLVDQLLDVTRIERGRLTISPQEVDLVELTRNVVEHYAEEAAKLGSELKLSAEQPVAGMWDPLRIEQVVTNLVTNAMKFGEGKPIEITVSRVPACTDEGCSEHGVAQIVVRDHGIGITAEDMTRIFNRFERAGNVSNYGGLGLGLYIARQIVAAHGGCIRAESCPGAGATFTVELPRLATASTKSEQLNELS